MNNKARKLNNGMVIPLMGMRTSRTIDKIISGGVIIKENNIRDVIYNSIKDGVRLIDTSYKYGNEREVGEGIKMALDEGICKREDLIIIGKIWIHFRKDPEKALKETLKKLKLDYIDVYMDHWPTGEDLREKKEIEKDPLGKFDTISIYDFWPKMENLIDKGLARSLGVSNYNVQCLCNLLTFCRIRPVMNEVEYHLFYIQNQLKYFCDKENIALISYYPIPGRIGERLVINEHPELNIFKDQLIISLSKKYEKTPGQIILNWHYCQGVIPIPSTSKTYRMKENLDSLYFKLDDEDVENLSKHFKQISLKKFIGGKGFFGVNLFA